MITVTPISPALNGAEHSIEDPVVFRIVDESGTGFDPEQIWIKLLYETEDYEDDHVIFSGNINLGGQAGFTDVEVIGSDPNPALLPLELFRQYDITIPPGGEGMGTFKFTDAVGGLIEMWIDARTPDDPAGDPYSGIGASQFFWTPVEEEEPEPEPDPEPWDDYEVEIESHCELAKNRLISQFKGKQRIEAELCIWADKIQELEQAFTNLREIRFDIDVAAGKLLDNLGLMMGWSRFGLTDVEYRRFLRARAILISSNGTPEEMILILQTMAGPNFPETITYQEGWEFDPPSPKATRMSITVPDGRNDLGRLYARMLREASSAGTNFMLQYQQETTPVFTFGDTTEPSGEDLVDPGETPTWGFDWAHADQGYSGYLRII